VLAAAPVAELRLDEPRQPESLEAAQGLNAQVELRRRLEVEELPRRMRCEGSPAR